MGADLTRDIVGSLALEVFKGRLDKHLFKISLDGNDAGLSQEAGLDEVPSRPTFLFCRRL